jgi:outer membrane immunogenic protein
MKRLFLGTVALLALAAVGAAGASAQPAPMNWSGLYIGGNGAFQSSNSNYKFDYDGSGGCSANTTSCNVFAPYPGGSFGQHSNGGGFGGQILFNVQAPSSHWAFGLEGSFSQPNLVVESTNVFGTALVNPTATYTSDLRSLITVTPRVGYVAGSTLLFVKGGLALARENTALTQSSAVEDCPCAFSGSHSFAGYTFGAGADLAIHPGWTAGIEYDFARLGSQHFGGATPATLIPTTTWPTGYTVNPDLSSVIVRVNYKL